MGAYALAIGADTAQGRPGDALEYTAASGGAAYIVGPADDALAICLGSFSFVTDTPDFWRRPTSTIPATAGASPASPPTSSTSRARHDADGGAGRGTR